MRPAGRPQLAFAASTRVVEGKRESLVLDLVSRRWLRISTPGLAAIRRRLEGRPAGDGPGPAAVEKALERLVEHGFLRPADGPPEPAPPPRPGPRSLHLHVTQRCNLECETCFVAEFLRRAPDRMSLADIVRLFDAAVRARFSRLTVTGGEPFLRRDLPEILAAARPRFRWVALTTNGTALTESSARSVAGLVDWINVSIDGATAEVHDRIRGQGAFERTLKGVRTLAASGFPMRRVSLNPTVTRLNHRDLEDVLDIAGAFGADVAFGFFMPTGRGLCNRDRLTLGSRAMADCCERAASRRKERLGIGPGEDREMTFPRVRTDCAIDTIVAVQADGSGAMELYLKIFEIHELPYMQYSPADPSSYEKIYPQMNGKKVFLHAVRNMVVSTNKALAATGMTWKDIDWFVPHQANLRINEAVVQYAEIPPEKALNTIQWYGNTTAATVPLTIDHWRKAGKVKKGDLVLSTVFGSGFTWGTAIFRL